MAEKWQLKAVLSANAESMIKSLGSVGKIAKNTRKYLLDIGKSAGVLSGKLGLPVGLLGLGTGALSIAGMKALVGNFIDLADEAVNTSKGMGLSIQEFQRLKYIAGQANVPVEALSASVGRLNKNIGNAVAGKNKDFAALMQAAGISLRDANGQIRTGADLLPELAELFKRNQNAALQARMGNTALGKTWQQLAALLNEGRGGIDAMTARYRELGFAMSDEAAVAGEELGDKLQDLRNVTAGYGNTIVAKLLPTLSPLIDKMTKWLVVNRELVSTKVAGYLAEIAQDLAAIDWSGVIAGARSFVRGVKDMVEWVGGAKNALIGLVIFMNLQTIAAFVGLVGSIVRAVWWFGKLAIAAGIKAATGLGIYTTATTTATTATTGLNVSAGRLLGTLGMIAAAAAPLAAIWGVKEWAEDTSHDQERTNTLRSWSDTAASWMPDWMGDPSKGARERYLAQRADLTVGNQAKVSGQVDINIAGLPPGSTVKQANTGNMPLNLDAGYSFNALAMP